MDLCRRLLRERSFRLLFFTSTLIVFYIVWHNHEVPLQYNDAQLSRFGLIPRNIWQCFDPSQTGHALYHTLGESIQSWIVHNPDFKHTLVSDEGANEFVAQHYHSQSRTRSTFDNIELPVLRADLLRYMLIESEGGYYGDVDTTLHKPIRQWTPAEYRDRARFLVGLEYDQLENPGPSHGFKQHISFAQWTFAATPGHPILTKVIDKVVNRLHDLAKKQGTTIAAIEVSDQDVGSVTGPAIWTLAVFEGMSEAIETDVSWENVTGIREPRLFGDILLMPVDAFGTGQAHSGASQDIVEGTYVRHHWKMSWRHLNEDGSFKPGTA